MKHTRTILTINDLVLIVIIGLAVSIMAYIAYEKTQKPVAITPESSMIFDMPIPPHRAETLVLAITSNGKLEWIEEQKLDLKAKETYLVSEPSGDIKWAKFNPERGL